MLALALCGSAFVACFIAARRSLVQGLAALLAVGYAYGIVRANVPSPASHFLFDAGVAGLYLALWMRPARPIDRYRTGGLIPWVVCLTAWPAFLFFVPMQDPLVQLVGLRGQIMFLPFLLIGALLTGQELQALALWVAALNIAVFGFAGAEWILGVQRFYPLNAVTRIIYSSTDVARGSSAMRIPATFVQSAAYAGTMVMTMPLLIGLVGRRIRTGWHRYLTLAALLATVLGVFMAASRTAAVVLIGIGLALTLSGRLKGRAWLAWVAIAACAGYLVYTQPSLQRFTTLKDTSYVGARVHGSVNEWFLNDAADYPLGNGLGGGGTSLPYFLQGRVINRVVMENEYARIMLEQGIPGLALWLAFIGWLLTRPLGRRNDPWYLPRWLARLTCGAYFATAVTGTGLLTLIPETALLLLLAGWSVARQPAAVKIPATANRRVKRANSPMVRRYGW